MVPYQRNPYFTGREDVLDALHEALRRGGSAALSQAEPAAALPQGTRTAISVLYSAQGRLAEAEPLFERSLKIRDKALGDEHPKVAESLENFALLLRATERTSEAEAMETRARTIRERHAARERERGSDT